MDFLPLKHLLTRCKIDGKFERTNKEKQFISLFQVNKPEASHNTKWLDAFSLILHSNASMLLQCKSSIIVNTQQPPVYKTGRPETMGLPVSRGRYSYKHQNSSCRILAERRAPMAWETLVPCENAFCRDTEAQQHMLEIGKGLNTVRIGAFHHGIYNSACFGSFGGITGTTSPFCQG